MSIALVVASTNPVKLAAAAAGFRRIFPADDVEITGVSAPSGVPDQPMSDEETERGALGRARAAQQLRPQADYWVGIEGGCAGDAEAMQVFAWVVVLGRQGIGRARTGMFYLPREVAVLVAGGMELGHAADAVFGASNSQHGDGTVCLLTGGVIDRTEYYAHAMALALVPFRNPALHFPAKE